MSETAQKGPWTATVATLFPEMFPGPLGYSLAGRALSDGVWRLETLDIRDFATDKHRTVDDAPYGGGPGMVMMAPPLLAAIEEAGPGHRVLLTPAGAPLAQSRVRNCDSAGGEYGLMSQ